MIHHHNIGRQPVEFRVTSEESILDQSRNLNFTKASRAALGLIEDPISFANSFLCCLSLSSAISSADALAFSISRATNLCASFNC